MICTFFKFQNIQCPECPKKFPMPILLRYHRQWEHGAKAEVCTICGKTRMSCEESAIFFTNLAYITHTLDSGIDVPPEITVALPLKKFHITISILFYINLGIAAIFKFFLSSKIFIN